MNQLWEKFIQTGAVEDYLFYRKNTLQMQNVTKTPEDDLLDADDDQGYSNKRNPQ